MVLIEAGLPEGTVMGHKYGWVLDASDGLMHTVSDAAVIYTPAGNFVFTVYVYHPDQLFWDDAQRLIAYLTNAAYGYYAMLSTQP
jgi:beta-lactamase class A